MREYRYHDGSEWVPANDMSIDNLIAIAARDQRELFGILHETMNPGERIDYIRYVILASLNELHEMLAEVDWKPYYKQDRVAEDRSAIVLELVDVLRFWMVLADIFGVTEAELVIALEKKRSRDRSRVKESSTATD